MARIYLIFTAVLANLFILISSASAEWASLSGKFVYDGNPPAQKELKPTKDVDFCGKNSIPDERLVVNPKNKGIANIVVYLRKKPTAISSSYDSDAKADVQLDNMLCRFEPHVQLLRTTQTLVVGNKDPKGHNTKADTFVNSPFNQLIPALGSMKQNLSAAERLPVKVSCSIHPWMTAIVVVQDHPYMAKTDENGKFEIRELPTGEKLDIQFWHESSGYVRKVTTEDVKISKKGRVKLTLDGDLDLGVIKVDPKSFK